MSFLTLLTSVSTTVLAKYPFLSTLLDSVSGASATFTRSTTKTFITDAGAVSSSAIDAPSYTGSGILLEPASTNRIIGSRLFNTYWDKIRCTISDNAVTSPDGTQNASQIVCTDATTSPSMYNTGYDTIGTWYISIFAKKVDVNFIRIYLTDGVTKGCNKWFNISTGAVGSTTVAGTGATVDDAGIVSLANGWYWCWVKTTIDTNLNDVYIFHSTTDGGAGSGGIGAKTNFFQLDYKTALTSPITTTIGPITRTVDNLSVPTTGYKTNDFAYYVEWTPKITIATPTGIYENYSSATNYVQVFANNTAFGLNVMIGGGTVQITVSTAPVSGTTYKILVRIINSVAYLNVNGTESTAAINGNNIVNNSVITLGKVTGLTTSTAVIDGFKHINTSNVTLAQATAL